MYIKSVKAYIPYQSGFTLIEVVVAGTISIILIICILRLYISSVNNYNLQDIITEMNQNANFTCRRLSEEVMQGGAYLPDSGYTVIEMAADKTDSICIRSNPTGATHHFVTYVDSTTAIEVANAWGFRGITEVVKLSSKGTISTFQIDGEYNDVPFENGVNTDSTPHVIRTLTKVAFNPGDKIFASTEHVFFLDGTNFCIGSPSDVLAENIDSMSVTFFDKSNNVITVWNQMMYAKIFVRSRASIPDIKYTDPTSGDHYRHTIQTMDILIRKKTAF